MFPYIMKESADEDIGGISWTLICKKDLLEFAFGPVYKPLNA